MAMYEYNNYVIIIRSSACIIICPYNQLLNWRCPSHERRRTRDSAWKHPKQSKILQLILDLAYTESVCKGSTVYTRTYSLRFLELAASTYTHVRSNTVAGRSKITINAQFISYGQKIKTFPTNVIETNTQSSSSDKSYSRTRVVPDL